MLTNPAIVLFSIGIVPLILNTLKDIIDNRNIDALKNASLSYAVITVWIITQQNLLIYTGFIFLLLFTFWLSPKSLGVGDYTAMFWILPTLYLLNWVAPMIFLFLFAIGIFFNSVLTKPNKEGQRAGYIPILAAYLLTGVISQVVVI